MRRAMDLIHYVVKDGVMETSSMTDTDMCHNGHFGSLGPQQRVPEDWDSNCTVHSAIKKFEVRFYKWVLWLTCARDDFFFLI